MAYKGVPFNPGPSRPLLDRAPHKDETVWYIQLMCIFTNLVPKILLNMLTRYIALNKGFQKKFGGTLWDGGWDHRRWLAAGMEKTPRVQYYICEQVKMKPATEWDITIFCAALSAVMEPSDAPCEATVTQKCSRKGSAIDYFDVSVSERTDCKTWEGFRVNVMRASPAEGVVECVVTEARSDTWIVAVSRAMANDRHLRNKISKDMERKPRLVYLPRPEVADIVKVRQSRNSLSHRSKTDVSYDDFVQYVEAVQALLPYCPKEDADGFLIQLQKEACGVPFCVVNGTVQGGFGLSSNGSEHGDEDPDEHPTENKPLGGCSSDDGVCTDPLEALSDTSVGMKMVLGIRNRHWTAYQEHTTDVGRDAGVMGPQARPVLPQYQTISSKQQVNPNPYGNSRQAFDEEEWQEQSDVRAERPPTPPPGFPQQVTSADPSEGMQKPLQRAIPIPLVQEETAQLLLSPPDETDWAAVQQHGQIEQRDVRAERPPTPPPSLPQQVTSPDPSEEMQKPQQRAIPIPLVQEETAQLLLSPPDETDWAAVQQHGQIVSGE